MDARIQTIMAHVRDFAEARHRQGHSTYNIETAAAEAVVVTALDAMLAAHDARVADIEAGGVERLRSPAEPAIAEAERTAPEAIWLDLGAEEALNVRFGSLYEVTWSDDNASGTGIKYIRADRAARAQAPAAVEPAAYIEHHKAGDNLVWDHPGGKHTPLYAAPTTKAEPAPVTDEMVDAYLAAQRRTVEEADRFGRPNIGGLHTDTVREACRQGLMAAIGAAADPARGVCE